ncbi:hypothetical protein RM844_15525 [Streptomyces sp. DSM 44915]|uniref:Uncharacterized protein n=1 Tax=Streptomyces chisholmiae TaxID=3075540 RepID=A0ABU2JSH4_9ACTN|nr:hypothetical protein [Streptomyces sp. DSM 44915]MDT0267696.1 hypothetical protein [Streptomyces sp. DSM 44915]
MTAGDGQPAGRPDGPAEQRADRAREARATPGEEAAGQPADAAPAPAWAAARELRNYAPGTFGGGFVAGDALGVSGGRVTGDVVLGDKIYLGADAGERLQGSGEVPPADLADLAGGYHESAAFRRALAELRRERVVVLRGEHGSGRRAAALMLLRRVGAGRVRQLAPDAGPVALVNESAAADGYLLCDLPTTRSNPLAQHHLLRCRERLRRLDAHLVVTVENSAVLREVAAVPWPRPDARALLVARLRPLLAAKDGAAPDGANGAGGTAGEGGVDRAAGEAAVTRLLELPQTRAFLAVATRPAGQLAAFAAELARHHRGEVALDELAGFGQEALRDQVGGWLAEPGEQLPLRDKAFLLALALGDRGPYSTAARLGDRLYRQMNVVESPEEDPGLSIFGTSLARRLELAHATRYEENEQTRWGPVPQTMVRFQDPRTPALLLREAWTGHPAARVPLARWLTELGRDADPFVRTRAAAVVATLAQEDFASVMHELVLGWAAHRDSRLRVLAANALALTAHEGTRPVGRVLRDLGLDADQRRRWTAVRGYALAGAVDPGEALDSLEELALLVPLDTTPAYVSEATAAAGDAADGPGPDGDDAGAGPGSDRPRATSDGDGAFRTVRHPELDHLAEAVGVLLLWVPGPVVPRRLAHWAERDSDVLRVVAWLALLNTARLREEPENDPASWPELLRRYADEPTDGPVRVELATLWRCVLRQRRATELAQLRLREWVLLAELVPDLEPTLGELLTRLAAGAADHDRLSYLLRTMPGEDGGPPPPVAARLLGRLAGAAAARD